MTAFIESTEGWVEVAFLPAAKYAVDWSEDRDGWVVLASGDVSFT